MTRIFPDFITAYLDYADNGFAPAIFHKWSCLSMISAALERKVWLPFASRHKPVFPNLYVMIVGSPGIGKSSASDIAVSMLDELEQRYPDSITRIPADITMSSLVETMAGAGKALRGAENIPSTVIKYHSSGFLYASEAANTLKDNNGSFLACITDFYDCHNIWKKKTNARGEVTIRNLYFGVLACTTYDFLGKLIVNTNIESGLASRFVYVRSGAHKARRGKFDGGQEAVEESLDRKQFRQDLLHDLHFINLMQGAYKTDPAYGELYERFERSYDQMMADAPSDKLRAILVRKPTIVTKVSLILAASESNELLLKAKHFEEALKIADEVEEGLAGMIREANALNVDKAHGATNAIAHSLITKHCSISDLRKICIARGFDPTRLEAQLEHMSKAGMIAYEGDGTVKLLVDPNSLL